ncbi:basic proline-rich protein-like [Cricetulus griseus]|uniref:Basic proline-rich protein-like n=1 Tax=Cricetulus griseus TaxID=10029 RepID=A0A9J7GWS4_CRIGR|nr:basic proline-rich protein-like [Cricetulus griseus]
MSVRRALEPPNTSHTLRDTKKAEALAGGDPQQTRRSPRGGPWTVGEGSVRNPEAKLGECRGHAAGTGPGEGHEQRPPSALPIGVHLRPTQQARLRVPTRVPHQGRGQHRSHDRRAGPGAPSRTCGQHPLSGAQPRPSTPQRGEPGSGLRAPGERLAHVLTAAAKAPRRLPPRLARLTRATSRAGAASGDHRANRPSPASLYQLSGVRCPGAPRVSSPRRRRRAAAASSGTYRLRGQAPLSAPGRERRREASRGAAPRPPRAPRTRLIGPVHSPSATPPAPASGTPELGSSLGPARATQKGGYLRGSAPRPPGPGPRAPARPRTKGSGRRGCCSTPRRPALPFLAQPRAASGRGRAVAGRPLAGAWGNAEPTPPPPRQAPPRQAPRARPGCRRPAGSPPRSLTRALEALLSRLGSDPPRPPSAPSPRRHACAVKSGALVKAATNDAAIKARYCNCCTLKVYVIHSAKN